MLERRTRLGIARWRAGCVAGTIAAIVIVAPTPASAAPATQLYVAPWGNDAWPGTVDRPFATPTRAQQAVRTRTKSMAADVVVNLRAGTYRLAAPLALADTAGDSGRNGHRVVYQAYGYGTAAAERVTLSGGRPIAGWRASADGTWRADVGGLETRQLYVGGRRADRAALPQGLPGKVTRTSTGYVTDSTAPQRWQRPQDIELIYDGAKAGGYEFTEPRCGVAGISGDAHRTTITMDQPCFTLLAAAYQSLADEDPGSEPLFSEPSGVENSPTFLRAAGSWYLDRSQPGRHVLTYRPRAGEDPARTPVVAPVLESLFSGVGTPASPLHDVAVRGLTFTEATWLAPSEPSGFAHLFGTWYVTKVPLETARIPGGVRFEHATRITVEGNHLTRLGGLALEFTGTGSHLLVRRNVVEDVSSGGISINPDGPTGHNTVDDNWVHHAGREYRGGIGINVESVTGTTVAHNQVNDISYSGIFFAGPDESTSARIQILDNHVFRTNQVLTDGGGIYGSGPMGNAYAAGAVIRGNVVHDVVHPWKPNYPVPIAVYTDNAADHITVAGNVMYASGEVAGGVAPVRLRFAGNFWDDGEPSWWPPSDRLEFRGNTLLPRDGARAACAANPTCAAILAGAGRRPSAG